MSAIGRQSGCDTWYFSQKEYINTISLGYTSAGVHYIQLQLNTGKILTKGTQLTGGLIYSQDFGSYRPLVGLQAYHSSSEIKGLGFVSYICGAK